MQNRTPCAPNEGNPIPDFTPVPRLKPRHDGWTPERQRALIDAIADTGSVTDACKRLNMSTEGAYVLKRAPGAEEFAAAWDAALDFGIHSLADLAVDRIRHGTPVPIFWKGEQVGERRRYNERLHMFILRHRLPRLYGQTLAKADPKQLEALKQEWQLEYTIENEEKAAEWIDGFMANIDRVRGAILRRCAADPDLQRSWELLCGETDWSAIPGWQPGEPTQFARDNLTMASTHIAMLQQWDESGATVGDQFFGQAADDQDEQTPG